jgi:hypothetical protein
MVFSTVGARKNAPKPRAKFSRARRKRASICAQRLPVPPVISGRIPKKQADFSRVPGAN